MTVAAGGIALALAFVLLCARQRDIALAVAAAQAVAVAVASLGRGAWLDAMVIIVFNAIAMPLALHRLPMPTQTSTRANLALVLAAAVGFALLAAPLDPGGIPLAILLLAILLTATHRDPIMQTLGLLAMQNAIALAAIGALAPTRFAAVLPVIPGLALAAFWMRRRRIA